nr:E3 ubiquitin-protein ligase RNF181-like [Quercus suber]POE68271.1 e3 ubiquitin-protein ligase ring1 [Quercus suber]
MSSTSEAQFNGKNVNASMQQLLPPSDLQVYMPLIGLNSQGEEVVFEFLVSSSSRLSDFVFHITTGESHPMTETETETTITLIETMSDNAVGEEQEYDDAGWLDYMDDEDYDDEEEEGDEEAVRPASEESIMGLEVVRIEERSVDLAGEACAVCLNEFSIGSEARRMPCSHTYHQDCIIQWLGRSNMCPMCRYRLP